jgi:hypothetical protein
MTRVENTQAPPRPQPLRPSLPIRTDPHSVRQRIEALEKALERGFRIPGIGYEFGLDAIVGLIPVVGDFVGDAVDFLFRSNSRNLKILKRHLDKHHPQTRVIEG